MKSNYLIFRLPKMFSKYKYLIVIIIFFISSLTCAQGRFTKIDNAVLFSEYYPNATAHFKGTIIFQNGAGTTLKEWTKNKIFFNCIRKYGNIFLYDRSGLGKSPPDLSMSLAKPMTAELVNSKLIKLLKKNNIKSPYILVAHSYGGMYAGYFARKYPNLVKGILMIDPVPNNYQWSDKFLKKFQSDIKKMDKLSSKEAYQQYSYVRANKYNLMTAQLFYQLKGFKQTKNQINRLPKMSSKFPIIIISSSYMDKNAPIKGNWYKLQHQWLNKNPNSKILNVHSGHFIQLEHPKLICEQLNELVELAANK